MPDPYFIVEGALWKRKAFVHWIVEIQRSRKETMLDAKAGYDGIKTS